MGRKATKIIQPINASVEEVIDAIFAKQKAVIKARKLKNKSGTIKKTPKN